MQRQDRPKRRPSEGERKRLDRSAAHYLQKSYRTKSAVRASDFAAYLQVSTEHLSREVARISGQTVHAFLRERQLTYAVQLLLMTDDLSVDQVAYHCAFGTPRTFFRAFRQAFGVTPTEYRQREKPRKE